MGDLLWALGFGGGLVGGMGVLLACAYGLDSLTRWRKARPKKRRRKVDAITSFTEWKAERRQEEAREWQAAWHVGAATSDPSEVDIDLVGEFLQITAAPRWGRFFTGPSVRVESAEGTFGPRIDRTADASD